MNDTRPTPDQILHELRTKREERPTMDQAYMPPTDEIESRVADIWSEILRIEPIGRLDNFFYLGGDSLNMVQVANRLRSSLGQEIEIGDFFDDPTVAGLSSVIKRAFEPLA
jgi:acyl carrier protein